MKQQLKKSGQKIVKKLSRASQKATEKSKAHIKKHFIARVDNVKTVRLWVLEWTLLVSAIILFAVIQSIWYRNSYDTMAYASGGTYAEATLGQINSMNPLYATTSSEKTLAKLLFSSLISVDTSGHLSNELAESVTVDETGKIWTAKLREGLKWSDGEPITADDIIYTYELINNPSAKISVSTGFSNTKIERIDDLTVNFSLPTVYVAFYDALDFPIVPEHILSETDPALIFEHDFSTNPVTSGPFVLNAVQASSYGKTVYLNKNTHYFKGEAMLDSFIVRTYETYDQITDALNRSEITATADLSSKPNPGISNSSIYSKKTTTNNGAFAFLNTLSDKLSNAKIRQAIKRGIDTDALLEGLTNSPLNYPILPQQINIDYPELLARDTDVAYELFASAGYKLSKDGLLLDSEGEQLTIKLATATIGILPDVTERLADQLTALGAQVETNIYEVEGSAQNFYSAIIRTRDYDILLYEIDMGTDPDLFPYYHSSQASSSGFNFSNYKSGIADDLLLSARTTFDASLRKAKYETFLNYWVNDVPAIGLYRADLTYFFNYSARTFSENSILTSPIDRFSDVQYWATEKTTKHRTP